MNPIFLKQGQGFLVGFSDGISPSGSYKVATIFLRSIRLLEKASGNTLNKISKNFVRASIFIRNIIRRNSIFLNFAFLHLTAWHLKALSYPEEKMLTKRK